MAKSSEHVTVNTAVPADANTRTRGRIVPTKEFIDTWVASRTINEVAETLGINVQSVKSREKAIRKMGPDINALMPVLPYIAKERGPVANLAAVRSANRYNIILSTLQAAAAAGVGVVAQAAENEAAEAESGL